MSAENLHEFHPMLLFGIRSDKKEFTFNFEKSRVLLKNEGKEVHSQHTGFGIQDKKSNIFELLIYSDSFNNAFHILDLIQCANTLLFFHSLN